MGISSRDKKTWQEFTDADKDRIVRMAWEDRTSFEAIEEQFGLSPNSVEKFMRRQLDSKAYKRWRRRASEQGHLKQREKRPVGVDRFKCSRQRLDGSTKGKK
jgi:uncharacterized protein (TIGR03643 family)